MSDEMFDIHRLYFSLLLQVHLSSAAAATFLQQDLVFNYYYC